MNPRQTTRVSAYYLRQRVRTGYFYMPLLQAPQSVADCALTLWDDELDGGVRHDDPDPRDRKGPAAQDMLLSLLCTAQTLVESVPRP